MPNGRVPLLPNSTSDLLRGIPKVARIIRSNKIDFVHCRSYVPAYIMLALRSIAPTPFIFDMRGFYPDEYVRYGHWTKKDWQYRFSKWLELRCIHAADWIVLTCQGMHHELMAVTGETAGGAIDRKSSIIPNCVDAGRFVVDEAMRDTMRARFGLSNSIVFLWLVGGITRPHMPEEICSFFRVAKTQLESSRLLVLTHTPGAEETLQRYGLTARDYMVASVAPGEVPKYVAMADAGLHFCDPAHPGSGIKIAEYLASGVPLVISSTVERAEELTSEARTGVIVKSFAPQAYAEAVVQLTALIADRVPLAHRCQAVAKERLSIDYAVNRYADVYRNVSQSC
jgi:glycosyltransferase involved in cell wall biosynthesis